MQTAEERLKFAIQFIQMDLDRLRAGDWLNLKEDLMDFLFPTGDLQDSPAFPQYHPTELSADDIKALQGDVKEILLAMLSLAEEISRTSREPVPLLRSLSPQLRVTPGLAVFPEQASGRVAPFFIGPTRDAILMQLIMSLPQVPLDTLRRCPECGTIFYRVRKQQYCSRPCVHRANMRTWRQSDAGKEYERERSHTRYKNRVQQQLGSNVSVGRRPRSGKQTGEA